jgi:hypothetical protein
LLFMACGRIEPQSAPRFPPPSPLAHVPGSLTKFSA